MYIERINLQQFKNYEVLNLQLSSGLNCFTGNNGAGKTNILDAVHYLAFTKSYFNPIDHQQAFLGGHFFVVEGSLTNKGLQQDIRLVFQKGHGKTLLVNGNEVPKFSDHIGAIPLVMIAPGDVSLIIEGSEERRRFVDQVISQSDAMYLRTLIQYNKVLDQRNKLLKDFKYLGGFNRDLLDSYNEQLVMAGNYLYDKRQQFLSQILPVFLEHYQWLSNGKEIPGIQYESELSRTMFSTLLSQSESADIDLMRTTRGIHRDDFVFTLEGQPLKKFGSQGQQKSFLIAVKLAQFEFLKQAKQTAPLLLLDDIFEKLDQERLSRLFQWMGQGKFGQVFITDTQQERVVAMCRANGVEARFFTVEEGRLLP